MKKDSTLFRVILWLPGFFAAYLIERVLDRAGFFERLYDASAGKALSFLSMPITITGAQAIVFIAAALLARFLLVRISGGNRERKERKEWKQKEQGETAFKNAYKYMDVGGGLLLETDIRFLGDSKLHLNGIQPYCTLHGEPPQSMVHRFNSFECPYPGCTAKISTSAIYENNFENLSAHIYSILKAEWEKRLN